MRISLVMALSLAILALADDIIIWLMMRRLVKRANLKRASIIWWGFAFLCYILFIVVLALPRRNTDIDVLPAMWMMFTFVSIYGAKTMALIGGLLGFIPVLWKKKPGNALLYIGTPLAIVTFISIWWGAAVTRKTINVTEVTIVSDKIPEAFNGYSMVQISDLHVGTWGNDTTFISQLVDTVNSLHPDVIVFTGDIVNRRTDEILPFVRPLSRFTARDGVFSIMGNHDYGDYITWDSPAQKEENISRLHAIQKGMGWTMLNNDHTFLVSATDSIALIGVENWGEPPFGQYGNLDNAYPKDRTLPHHQNDSAYKILLTHNPEHWRQVVSHSSNIDLSLSGHTHAMQIMFTLGDWKWSPSALRYEEWGGLYETLNDNGEPVSIYVNIGAGEVGMPFRIGATPEVTLLRFYKSEKDAASSPTKARKV